MSGKTLKNASSLIGAAALALGALSAVAQTSNSIPHVTISDLLDGIPLVDSDIFDLAITGGFEEVTVTGKLRPLTSPIPAPLGVRSVILLEPSTDPFGPRLSDFLTLTVGEILTDQIGQYENITLFFQSDGAAGFDANVARLSTDTPRILEDGTVQDVSQLLGLDNSPSGNLRVSVQSDIASNEVPDTGATCSLLGIAFAGLALLRRKLC